MTGARCDAFISTRIWVPCTLIFLPTLAQCMQYGISLPSSKAVQLKPESCDSLCTMPVQHGPTLIALRAHKRDPLPTPTPAFHLHPQVCSSPHCSVTPHPCAFFRHSRTSGCRDCTLSLPPRWCPRSTMHASAAFTACCRGATTSAGLLATPTAPAMGIERL